MRLRNSCPAQWLFSILLLTCILPVAKAQWLIEGFLDAGESDGSTFARLPFAALDTEHEIPLDAGTPPINIMFEDATIYGFANKEGRVYVGGRTGRSLSIGQHGLIGGAILEYATKVHTKTSDNYSASFRVAPSHAALYSTSKIVPERPDPRAIFEITVSMCPVGPFFCEPQLFHQAEVTGHGGWGAAATFRAALDSYSAPLQSTISGAYEEVINECNVQGCPEEDLVQGAIYSTEEHIQEVALSSVPVNGKFYMHYLLQLIVYAEGGETWAEAFVADPFSADGGISFEAGAGIELATDQSKGQFQKCNPSLTEATPDHRFLLLPNDTVNDTVTGLNWPRCTQGHTLDDAGTDDLADDSCVAGGTTEFTWRAALQEGIDAATRGDYGNTDWRQPNAKELTTLVETACSFPAINTDIFPETVTSNIWTNTPSDFGFAFAVNFNSGRLDTLSQSSAQAVRLVRVADDVPPPVNDRLFVDGFESP